MSAQEDKINCFGEQALEATWTLNIVVFTLELWRQRITGSAIVGFEVEWVYFKYRAKSRRFVDSTRR